MKKQYTVKEINDWEGETFNYVLLLDDSEVKIIKEKIDSLGDDLLSIKETSLTDKDIQLLNDNSDNSYMNLFQVCALNENSLENWEEFGDCFYKRNGLTKVNSLKDLV